ncbi:scavenger receptor class F member 1-like isoform X2 [Halichondria panicea]|uniref:scavenger receptor class F member 1-like isoform X2 n=1 Tax=Halichondria panicea TaxID=6063 RepID=UPI00312B5FD1
MMVTKGYMLRVALLTVILMATSKTVSGEFILTVNLVNYTNPTGLCAECQTRLINVTSADQLPVCCDELPFKSGNCDNTGEEKCDTRFRWTIRPFGASLEARPPSIPNAANPPYFFTNCTMSPSTCPFSEMSTTFDQGLTALLGVTENPLPVSKTDFTMWTGRIQFFIEAVDSGLPNIIDSLLINLDNLQLGADFTEEMTFTGFHNISHMTMSFRVECSPGFCGPDCTTTPQTNPLVATCQADGSLTCTNNRLDPSPLVACNDCLYNLDITTGCSTCVQTSYDPSTNCTQCLPGWDITSDCTSCLPNRDPDPVTNCSLCLQPDRFTDTDCSVCALPGGDPATLCQTCLATNFDPNTNCSECIGNLDLSSSCSTCLPGYDSSLNCALCLSGRNISTRCTTCLAGFTGSNCEPVSSVNGGLVGGIAGGALFLVIIVLVIIVCVLVCKNRRRGHIKFVSDEGAARNAYDNTGTGTGSGSSAEHKFQNSIYGPGLEMDLKTGTGSSDDHAFTNSLYETSNVNTEDDYSQLRHPSVSPPSHTVKTGTQDLTSTLDGPMYDTASYPDDSQPREGTPVNDTADHTHRLPPTNPPDEDYSKLRQPPVTSVTPQPSSSLADYDTATFIEQPVYDEAFPPPDDSLSKKGTRHPSKSAGAYEEIEDEDIRGRDEYDTTYPPPSVIPSVNAYSKVGKHEAELPAYDVANNHHLKQVQPKAPPPNGSLYDTADYPQEQATRPKHNYTETSDFLPPSIKKETSQHTYDYADASEFLSASSSAKHSYDYVDNPIDSTNALPPALAPLASSVYTNTMPDKITLEAEAHYDLGQ